MDSIGTIADIAAFLAVAGFAVFIVWEGWTRRRAASKPLPRAVMERGFVPGASNHEVALFAAAAALAFFGLFLIYSQTTPPFIGRGAYVFEWLYGAFGPLALPALLLLLGLAALASGLAARRRRLSSR